MPDNLLDRLFGAVMFVFYVVALTFLVMVLFGVAILGLVTIVG